MKEKTKIHSDEFCVYISTSVSNPLYGKIALIIADMLILAVLIIAVTIWIPALVLASLIFIFFLTKYTLWNIYGTENVIINTKTVSYQHDYGFFRTGYTTIPFKKGLNLKVAPAKPAENKELLILISSYDDNDLPVNIYTMALSIPEDDVIRLDTLIKQLFVDKMADEYMLPPIHLN